MCHVKSMVASLLPVFQHLIFIQRSMQPVKKMESIFQRNDTIRRRVKRRYSNLPQIFFFLRAFTYSHTL